MSKTDLPNVKDMPRTSRELFEAHYLYVKRFLYSLGVRDERVEDAAQEVFIIAHLRGGYAAGPATPRTWLGAIAIRVAANVRRNQQRERARWVELHPEEHASAVRTSLQTLCSTVNVEVLLEGLPPLYRTVFTMFVLEDCTCTEIAQALKIPIGTVYSRLYYAKASLKEAIQERGV